MCSTCDCDAKSIVNEPVQVKRCRKCTAAPFIVLDKVHVECQSCFLESCNRKIRSTIGKSKLLKNNDPILIAYSGGPCSAALLDLIRGSMEYEARREQKFRPSIIHVDTQSVLNHDFEHLKSIRKARLDALLSKTRLLYPNWPIYWTSIEMLFAGSDPKKRFSKYSDQGLSSLDDSILLDPDALRSFRLKIEELDNLTDRQSFTQLSIKELISEVASQINIATLEATERFSFVFVGSSATQLANDLLVSVILGQGSSIRSKVSVCDDRTTVKIIRPMRDFSKKEIMFYLRARNLENYYRVEANLITFADRKSSIQSVTEAFLNKLQLDYPSTCSTLLRTGNKMQD